MRSNTEPDSIRSFTEDARRVQIIGGAIDVLAENGYGATSLSAIAEHLGISKGVISYHFAGKAELLQEVVRYVLHLAESWMTPRVASSKSYAEALAAYIASNLTFLGTHRVEIFAITEVLSNARVTPGVPELFRESQDAAVAALETLFGAGTAAGEFGEISPRVAAISLRASIDTVTGLLRSEPDFDLEAYSAQLAALFGRASTATR